MRAEANFHLAEARSCRESANRYLGQAAKSFVSLGGATVLTHGFVEKFLPDETADRILKVGAAATLITTIGNVASSVFDRAEAFFHEQKAHSMIKAEEYGRE